ncbi:unnamed protein product [Euphydryas editha]|uniref:SWIM-type domain-containing protein n=1 Tax=Euphydryas editha TaxID=104508 RepID=A0AAU9UZ65_EUPED|nr:unnamed protein product [Euphydryas editha]
MDNKLIPHVEDYYKIAAFILNYFGTPITHDTDLNRKIIERMKALRYTDNTLATEIEEKRLLRRKQPFQKLINRNLLDFPEMSEEQLKLFFTGTYQYCQAISYLAEMLNDDGTLNIEFLKDQSHILKFQVRSRHVARKSYRCFIEYVPNTSGCEGISRYFCECPNGRRTVGCCSHLAAVIYYLSYGRYLTKIPRPAEQLSQLFKNENMMSVIEEDSDNE